jgi:starch synthase
LGKPLKILFVTSELAPLISTGGLADVAASLPQALKAQGHDVRIIMPCFGNIPLEYRGDPYCLCVAELGAKVQHGAMRVAAVPGTDIPLYLIEHEGYFGRERPYGVGAYEYDDNAERFCFFCLAALHAIPQTHWRPDIVHCHDWHTAPIPAFLRTRFQDDPFWGTIPTLFTIHNLAFQGRYGAAKFADTGMEPWLFQPNYVEYQGDMNLMKAAIVFSTKLNTVSPRYAKEIQTLEYGAGLDGVLGTRSADLHGILNGVDYTLWNPSTDAHLPANYDQRNLSGKQVCKKALQEAAGLPVNAATPVIGIVSRLFWQKGLDLVVDALDRLAAYDLQLVVLGSGDPDLERRLTAAAQRYPDRIKVRLTFDVPLSHLVQAGSDFFLMPSRYEPCGLSQLYSMAYGTVPIVRRTGGLADSVRDINPVYRKHKNATGISFVPLTVDALVKSIRDAMRLYADKAAFATVQHAGMNEDFSWERSCRAYTDLYAEAIAAA